MTKIILFYLIFWVPFSMIVILSTVGMSKLIYNDPLLTSKGGWKFLVKWWAVLLIIGIPVTLAGLANGT